MIGSRVASNRSPLISTIRSFSSNRSCLQNQELSQFKKQLDELIYYEQTPDKLKHFIYRPKHAENVLRAELFDKTTGRPLRPTVFQGYPKVSVFNQLLSNVTSFEELVGVKKYLRQLDESTNYLQPIHLINFIVKSGEFEKSSYGLKTIYNLKNVQYNDQLIRFIYLIRLLKFENNSQLSDYELLTSKLKAPFHKADEATANDPILNLLAYLNYAVILKNDGFKSLEAFKEITKPYVEKLLTLKAPTLPQGYDKWSTGKKLSLYSSLKLEHAFLKKVSLVLSELSSDIVPETLSEVVTGEVEPFVTELDDLIYSIEGHEDYLTTLEQQIKFPAPVGGELESLE